ncbi:MAG: hypothetical protein L0229_28480 [Blastocatellia bacterium]|nr:hypothetical protein [Blastocatellia bacterium]
MNLYRNHSCLFIIPALIAFFFLQSPTHAQTADKGRLPGGGKEERPQASREDPVEDDRIEQLKAKVEQLESLVERQQRLLAEMEGRLRKIEGTKTPAALVTSSLKSEATVLAQPESESRGPEGIEHEAGVLRNTVRGQDDSAMIAGWDKDGHAFLRSADGDFETSIIGYGQIDFRAYQSGDHPPNTFLIRRARLGIEGKIFRYFDYRIQGDFADRESAALRDFYVNVHRIEKFQLRFGQFKEPFSQENLHPASALDFVERSLVNALTPDRSPGIMASGVFNKGVFEYYAGAFNGKGILEPNDNGTPENVVRLRFAPWKKSNLSWAKGLAFGGAYAQGREVDGLSVRGQTESRSFTFFNSVPVNGKIIRANAEMSWMLGPASIRAEYDQTNQEREGLGPAGADLPGVVAKGYMAQLTYLLTGETKPDGKLVTPKHNLFSSENGRTGLGAWELKLRYSNLQISDGTANANRAGSFYFGTNWYLNSFVKHQLDLGFERFKDPLRTPNPGDRGFFAVLSRVQLTF